MVSEYVTTLVQPDGVIPGDPLPEIALIGRSNVGKSSLLNLLVGRKTLAHASRTPGKTRALNVFRWGNRVHLVDVPGYGWAQAGHADRAAWRNLMERYIGERPSLVGVLWLLDIRRDPSPDDLDFGSLLARAARPTLIVLTKGDQVARGRRPARLKAIAAVLGTGDAEFLVTSARKREGGEELRDAVLAFLD